MKPPIWTVVSDLTPGHRLRLQRSKFTEVNHHFLHSFFSAITSELLDLEHRICDHYVPLVETD